MYKYFANIIFSPMHWIWTNIINRPIYGVKVWQIAFVLALVSLFYRVIVFPILSGSHFSISMPGTHGGVSRSVWGIGRIVGSVKGEGGLGNTYSHSRGQLNASKGENAMYGGSWGDWKGF